MSIEIRNQLDGHIIKICNKCHQIYEKKVQQFKLQLLEIFQIKQDPHLDELNKALGFVFILRKRDGLIMKDRLVKERYVKRYYKNENISFRHAKEIFKKEARLRSVDKKLLECFPSYESFYDLWKEHFIYYMKPQCHLENLRFKTKDNLNVEK